MNLDSTFSYFQGRAGSYQTDSERWPWAFLRRREAATVFKLLGKVAGHTFLELGCGSGYYTRLLLKNGANHVFAVDFCAAMIQELPRAGVTPIVDDAASVQLDIKFKRILCLGLLEFVPDAGAVLYRARELAEDGCLLVILLPADNMLGWFYKYFHRRHGIHVRLFTIDEIKAIGDANGWVLEKMVFKLPFSYIMRFRGV